MTRLIVELSSQVAIELLEGFQGSKKKLIQDLIEETVASGELFRIMVERNSGALKEGYRFKYAKLIEKGMAKVDKDFQLTKPVETEQVEPVEVKEPVREALNERLQLQTTVKPVMTNTETVRTRPAGQTTKTFRSSDFKRPTEDNTLTNTNANSNAFDLDE